MTFNKKLEAFLLSFTRFRNKIGFNIREQMDKEVVLVWPYKDCILEGGQTRGEEKKQEIFFNVTLARDEITKLLEPKALTNFEKWDKNGRQNITGFARDAELNRKRGLLEEDTITDNLLIKGNNLLALHSLSREFRGKVKCIYIDPPYNTQNDSFNYNDNFTHSAWLTFMKNRLEIARDLLKEDGVIFVQCDDGEQAYLKVLMDEIFGRSNFIVNFIWEKTQHFGRQKINYYSNAEYLITYGKNLNTQNGKLRQILIEKYIREFEDAPLYNASNPCKTLVIPPESCEFKIKDGIYDQTENENFQLMEPVTIKNGKATNTFKINFRSRWTNQKLQDELKSGGKVIIKSKDFSPRIIYGENKKSFVSPKQIIFTNAKNLLVANALGCLKVGTTSAGTSENKGLFGNKNFDYPKPESLIAYLLEVSTKANDIILDFFGGSGTTAAVAHKMGRQWITIEQMDYVEEITKERLKKVLDGEQGGISKAVNWQGGGEFLYLELNKYNQTFMERLQDSKDKPDLLAIYEEMKGHSFLNYDVNTKSLEENREKFEALGFEDLQNLLLNFLNANMLYQPLSSLEDKFFGLSPENIRLNKTFYRGK